MGYLELNPDVETLMALSSMSWTDSGTNCRITTKTVWASNDSPLEGTPKPKQPDKAFSEKAYRAMLRGYGRTWRL